MITYHHYSLTDRHTKTTRSCGVWCSEQHAKSVQLICILWKPSYILTYSRSIKVKYRHAVKISRAHAWGDRSRQNCDLFHDSAGFNVSLVYLFCRGQSTWSSENHFDLIQNLGVQRVVESKMVVLLVSEDHKLRPCALPTKNGHGNATPGFLWGLVEALSAPVLVTQIAFYRRSGRFPSAETTTQTRGCGSSVSVKRCHVNWMS